jgi:CRISPR-associated protein Cas2
MDMIVAYDIANPRRLVRVAKVIKDYGLRVQKSVFEVNLDEKRFAEMKRRVEEVINEDEDGVKYFPLCEKCAGTVEVIGQGVFIDPDAEYLVV